MGSPGDGTRRRCKAVLFDLDDTLVLTGEADVKAFHRVAEVAAELAPGVDAEALISEWRGLFHGAPWDPEGQVEVEAWRAGLWLRALQAQGRGDAQAGAALQACFNGTRLEHFRFLPGVPALVAELRSAGYRLAIITNGHHAVQRSKVAACAAHELFDPDAILVGGEEVLAGRQEKPHPGIFHRACELLSCSPGEAVHVGDSLRCDVGGAAAAGLAASVWVNAKGRALPEGAPRPTFTVATVLELPPLLRSLEEEEEEAGGGGGEDCGPAAA